MFPFGVVSGAGSDDRFDNRRETTNVRRGVRRKTNNAGSSWAGVDGSGSDCLWLRVATPSPDPLGPRRNNTGNEMHAVRFA